MTTVAQALPLRLPLALAYTPEEAEAAAEAWGFNCGPASICALLGMTPAELRPHLLDFELKRYTNPTLMIMVLQDLGVLRRRRMDALWPDYGVVRLQWAGPWTREGVPMRARYRHTHWVASCVRYGNRPDGVFDVNVGHWTPFENWRADLVPWLLKECEPKATGEWWVTHSLEAEP